MSDLAIWHEVALHLANHRGVRLVASCDGSRCAADVAAFADSLEFPVLVYGEVIDAQAVLNADFLGQCLVQKTDTEAFGAKWRDAGLTPAQISQRILQ